MKTQKRVGVVVGRFQTPYLHDGHKHLLDIASGEGRSLMILVGVSGGSMSSRDPIDFHVRAVMLRSYYPDAVVVPIYDHSSNKAWSLELDSLVDNYFKDYDVTLFGSRDSFIPHYKGRHSHRLVKEKMYLSATSIRKDIVSGVIDSEDFRAGIVYAATRQGFPTSFQVTDVVIRHSLEPKVLVGRKKGEENWRFPGGFVDPDDVSLERAAKREVKEEVGDVEIADMRYVGSFRINDHRYRGSEHKMMTALFSATYVFGRVYAGDDLEEVRWQSVEGLMDCLIQSHKPLGEAYLSYINSKTKTHR